MVLGHRGMVEEKGIGKRDPQKKEEGVMETMRHLGHRGWLSAKRWARGSALQGGGRMAVHRQVAEVLSGSICSRGAEDSERRDGEMVWNKHWRARLSYLPPGPVLRGVQEKNQPLLGGIQGKQCPLERAGFQLVQKRVREDEENSEHLLMEDWSLEEGHGGTLGKGKGRG